jgi:DNA sulfur modification protein DndB
MTDKTKAAPLGNLAETPAKRLAEFKRRKKLYVEQNFRQDEREHAISSGWELIRENKSNDRYRKLRTIDEQLENEFWRLLYEFGYPVLNEGRNFQLNVVDRSDRTVAKQIDVFAYDSQTIILAECKAAEKRTKRSLQKDIGEFVSLKGQISTTLRKHFGGKFDQKIVWLFVTKNIDWSESDRARAREGNIRVIVERELFYYKEIVKRIGHAARFQFHAEFLERTKVAALDKVEVNAIKTKLGPHKVLTFFAPAEKILPISFVNHRDLRDPNAAPSYQRLIQKPRLKQIADFISTGGFFPNTIILNFKCRVHFDRLRPEDEDGVAAGILTLPNTYKSAWIIDGQHRLYGYSEIEEPKQGCLLPFLAFENISIAEETKLFSDINSKQKRVEKRLLDEITGEIKLDSADKREQMRAIASRVFDLMRDDDDGPLGGKIAGVEIRHNEASTLTIPYLVDAVLQSGIIGRVVNKDGKVTYLQGPISWSEPREGIESLTEFMTEYLNLFRVANVDRWELGKSGKIASNPGVAGIIRFSGDVIAYFGQKEDDPRALHPKTLVERLTRYIGPIASYLANGPDAEIDQRFHTPFGSGGPRIFQHRLRELVRTQFKDFSPPGFEDDLRRFDAERTRTADQMVRAIQEGVHRHIIDLLKEHYGSAEGYLERGIENKEILKKAYEKKLDSGESEPKDMGTYLDFLDLKKIAESPRNWPFFSKTLDLKLPNEQKGKAKYVKWFDEVNKVRRIPAHPYNRGYSDDEYSLLELVHAHLTSSGVIVDHEL